MGANTRIAWTDHTENFWIGCIKKSPGCKFCYMFREQEERGNNGAVVTRTSGPYWNKIKSLHKKAEERQTVEFVFTNSYSDFFLKEADKWREEAWYLIKNTPWFTWLILTKEPERIKDCLPPDWGQGYPNVWLGTSIESDKYKWRVEHLLSVPAYKYFLSLEPLLGPVNLKNVRLTSYWGGQPKRVEANVLERLSFESFGHYGKGIDWVIVGGESGQIPEAELALHPGKQHLGFRPMATEDMAGVLADCEAAGVPVFLKQLGTYQARKERLKDRAGANPDEWPEPLRSFRQRPEPYTPPIMAPTLF